MQPINTASIATSAMIKVAEKETKYKSNLDMRPKIVALFQTHTTHTTYTTILPYSKKQEKSNEINLLVTWKNKGVKNSTVFV